MEIRMAATHKSKYKNPKDLEKSTKPKLRKDIKDYVEEDKNGTMVPNSTGKKQTMVPRKDDKKIIHLHKAKHSINFEYYKKI